jgi:hypothetical protein
VNAEDRQRGPLTREHLLSEPSGPAWQKVTAAELRQLPMGAPGVYAHVTREHGYVLYVGTGTSKRGGVRGRLRDEFRWISEIHAAGDVLATQRQLHEGVSAGLAEHDFETWAAVTGSKDEALGWELYFQGLSWRLRGKLLPLAGWKVGGRVADDWILKMLNDVAEEQARG